MQMHEDTRLMMRLASAGAWTCWLWLASVGCADPDRGMVAGSDAGAASRYPEVQAIILRSCAIARCHNGPIFGGGLLLSPQSDFRAALVGIPACEYDRMALVEPGHPELSWLMVKLTAPFRPTLDPYANYIEFDPPAGWDPDQRRCRDVTEDGQPLFGQRMPATAPNQLPDADLQAIEDWIVQGAPP